MICKLNNLLKIIFLLIYFVTVVLGDCVIQYPKNNLIKPRLKIKIGSREIEFTNNNDFTNLHNNQEIIASCDINFVEPDRYSDRRELNIRCSANYIYINGNSYSNNFYMECASLKWNLYELSEPFVWCPSHMASYILARPNGNEIYTYRNLAGVCYDTDNMTLSSIYYTMAPKHYKDMSPSTLASYEITPSREINYIKETFESKSVTAENYSNKQFKNWIKFANYEYNSTIQNPNLYNEVFNDLGSLLDFQWWPNLRLGNWLIYEEALAQHIEKESKTYDILAGISGTVMAPTKDSCENNYTMKHLIDDNNNKIPLYVWNYLYPTFNSEEHSGIVIIGFNSPFKDFYAEKDVVFCQDICHTIDWLQNVRSTFRYNTMGIVFCCTVKEVRSSNRLNGFPQKITKPIPEDIPEYIPPRSRFQQTTTTEYIVDDEDESNYFGD